jgi:hypothetical protein
MSQIGVITEQNDLGLGFDPLNMRDQKALNSGKNLGFGQNNSSKNNEDSEKKEK